MRTIGRVDIKGIKCVKGYAMEGQFVIANAINVVDKFSKDCDEIFICDTIASHFSQDINLSFLEELSRRASIPLIYGGGINCLEDAISVFEHGADKIAINSSLISNPILLSELTSYFGSQSIILSVQAVKRSGNFVVAYEYGRNIANSSAFNWIEELITTASPGEVLLTSVMHDGTMQGIDYELTSKCKFLSRLPVIYCGGISCIDQCIELENMGFQAAAISSMFHEANDYSENSLTPHLFLSTKNTFKVCILDLGYGNMYSLKKAFSRLDVEVFVSALPNDIISSDLLVLPGVGNYGHAMHKISELKILSFIKERIASNKAVLGICLGFQLLFSGSNESPGVKGISIFDGHFQHLSEFCGPESIVPNISFSHVTHFDNHLMAIVKSLRPYYFIHSYALKELRSEFCTYSYSIFNKHKFISSIRKGYVFGAQFHPELSGDAGIEYLDNIVSLVRS